ncbi:MAG: hypothetical protein R6X02_12055 [Enhygromyxa sp.]
MAIAEYMANWFGLRWPSASLTSKNSTSSGVAHVARLLELAHVRMEVEVGC